jgi:hypothetical protein
MTKIKLKHAHAFRDRYGRVRRATTNTSGQKL